MDAIAEGIPAASLKDELLDLEARKVRLERDLEATTNEPLRLHPNMAEIYRQKIAAFHDLLEKPESKAEAFEAIRSLIDRIVLTPVNDELRIDLHGAIAAILQLAANKNGPIRDLAEKAEQLVMVAGVGFEPTTFRL